MRRLGSALALSLAAAFALAAAPRASAEGGRDSDGDGLSDFDEVHKYRTDPARRDSDGDGVPDAAGDERRERTYSIRFVVEHEPPAAAVSDGGQDAREISRDAQAVRLEIVVYPFSTADAEGPDEPRGREAAAGLEAFVRPTLTCDVDDALRAQVEAEARAEGLALEALGGRERVRAAAAWALARSRTVDVGFTTYCVTARDGRLAVEEGCETYLAQACARPARPDDGGGPLPLAPRRTLEQQLDAEVRGGAMFRGRTHGSCTSTAIYLQTVLRALGVPTRTTVGMPPADGNDPEQVARLAAGLRPSAFRDAILRGPQRGWAEHTFNVVNVGGRWLRLDGARLGGPVVDLEGTGLLLRVLDYDDLTATGASRTWGRRWALTERTARFPTANPYRLVEVSDLLGPHAAVTLPPARPPPADRAVLTVTAAHWTTDHPPEALGCAGADALEVALAEAAAGEGHAPYTRFALEADVRFVLRAPGRPDVPAEYSWTTIPRDGVQRMVLRVRRADLAEAVPYALVPLNERGTRLWRVADGVLVTR